MSDISLANIIYELQQLCDGESLDPPSELFVEKMSRLFNNHRECDITEAQIAILRELHERYA